eukprot:6512665-Prymnesium_polylepis.1
MRRGRRLLPAALVVRPDAHAEAGRVAAGEGPAILGARRTGSRPDSARGGQDAETRGDSEGRLRSNQRASGRGRGPEGRMRSNQFSGPGAEHERVSGQEAEQERASGQATEQEGYSGHDAVEAGGVQRARGGRGRRGTAGTRRQRQE